MKETVPDVRGPGWYTCPGCSEAFDPVTEAESSGGVLRCPFCSTPFTPPAESVGEAQGTQGQLVFHDRSPLQKQTPFADPFPTTEAASSESFVVDDEPEADSADEKSEPPEDQELSGLRVRQLSALRRGAYRSRSYCLICVFVCVFAAVKLVVMTERYVRFAGWRGRPVGYVLGALAALMVASFFWKQVVYLTRELRKPTLQEPETDPDFSTLSDGSQHWKHLEEM